MIFICVKWKLKPEHADGWIELTRDFTEATRAEEGNLFFEWSRSVDEPNSFVLLEAFHDGDAGGVHVNSDHFKKAIAWMPDVVATTPSIINFEIQQDGWGPMGEVQPR